MSEPDPVVTLNRAGHESLDVPRSQVTISTLSRCFGVDPDTAYLREEFGQRAFFPDANNDFQLPSSIGVTILSLVVEGSHVNVRPPSTSMTSSTPGPSYSGRPIFSTKKEVTVKVKVVQATMKKLSTGKYAFNSENQTYVTVTEGTANLDFVSQAVQRKWGAGFVLVTSDGLKLDDSAQGIQFWKVGSRKIYAVRESDLKPGRPIKTTKTTIFTDSDSSDDEFVPFPKRSRIAPSKQPNEFDQLLSEVRDLRKSIGHLFEVDKQLPIPMGLRKALNDTFRCVICQSIVAPPVIFGRCCKSLIGCQSCVDQWYRGESGLMQSCPRCRAERGYSDTCIFKGLDEFLTTIQPLVQGSQESSTATAED